MIKAILYDLGDIFFEAHYWRKWMYEQFKDSGNFRGTFAEFYDLYETFLIPVYENREKYDNAYLGFLQHLGVKNIHDFKKRSFLRKKYYEDNRKLYDGVKETLLILKNNGVKNVVISDNESGAEELRRSILSKFGLNELIDKVFTSVESGYRKPHPKMFGVVLDKLGLTKKEVLFVAHDKDEIDGAMDQDITVVEFNNYLGGKTAAEYRISDFGQLPDLLSKLEKVE